MSNVCPRCRTYNSESSRFCSRCGTPLTARQGDDDARRTNGLGGRMNLFSNLALILSIASCALAFVPYANILGLLAGVPALVFSILCSKELRVTNRKSPKITTAFILSIVGLATCLIGICTVTVCVCQEMQREAVVRSIRW